MRETPRTKAMRWAFNLFPCFLGTGGRITYISGDLHYARIAVPLNWRTRNYVGTIFGGSMFGAVDPIYLVMFMKLLGPDYVIWDKAASIQYKKPGRSKLHAEFAIDDAELVAIRQALERAESVDRTYRIDLTDREGTISASIEKTLHFRKRRPSSK